MSGRADTLTTADVIDIAVANRRDGHSWRRIAAVLEQAHVRTRLGTTWQPDSLRANLGGEVRRQLREAVSHG